MEDMMTYPIPERVRAGAYISSLSEYQQLYRESMENPRAFWETQACQMLDWIRPFSQVLDSDLKEGLVAWFLEGQLNACYNCVDRHLTDRADQVAIIWEGDEPDTVHKITYLELHREVCRFANALKRRGVGKGDRVAIYMPMIPEAAVAMLACARIGAIHSVVFAGFSSEALQERIVDSDCRCVVTANEGSRGKKSIPLKRTVDKAVSACPNVHTVFVVQHTDIPYDLKPQDVDWHDALDAERPYCPCEAMNSEDLLFLLYTSGSTGKPKGLAHSTAGYLLHVALTQKYVFDCHDGDVHACMADIGWITGHSYVVYGPLLNGTTTLMFESVPGYPDAGRYWDMVERHKINIFYTAPTAIRSIARAGDEFVKKYDRSSLRVLGSVGEPINPEAWKWYYEVVGDSQCTIVDTWWQTETGGVMITPLPGVTLNKPGCATRPFFGVEPVILNEQGEEVHGNDVSGLLAIKRSWPGMARTIYGDHQRYLSTYLRPFPGYYFTGDGCRRDEDGYYWITGRVDDVINVSGHRLGTAEVESALVMHPACAEAAVVASAHEVKGQGIFAYVVVRERYPEDRNLIGELKNEVRNHIGPIATPDEIVLVPGLPKTRSGKIMRRILRKIADRQFEDLGDTSTLSDPRIVEKIIELRN
ncbi:acetate--CoA ligase [Candidatus Haliotispira prima]|uniref:Acetyl-coenzyme A synthetase n=1 Tax=Candidatus Haliotispira prima TaxID=3034016 RepID=A0ABY8MN65_9SPIO|nr:acetate--CoA ligase [Candidatus Haliotispira prima]